MDSILVTLLAMSFGLALTLHALFAFDLGKASNKREGWLGFVGFPLLPWLLWRRGDRLKPWLWLLSVSLYVALRLLASR